MRVLILILLVSCSSSSELKNSKKLILKGHKSLYHNGAFKIPYSTAKIIPAGPDVFSLSSQMGTTGAKSSFVKALGEAKESYLIVKKGAVKSYKFSKKAARSWGEIADVVDKKSEKQSLWLIKKSAAATVGLIKGGFDYSVKESKKTFKEGDEVFSKSLYMASDFKEFINSEKIKTDKKYDEKIKENISSRKSLSTFKRGTNSFVKGYLDLPSHLKNNYNKLDFDQTFEEYGDDLDKSKLYTQKFSDFSFGLVKDSIVSYTDNVNDSLKRARAELNAETDFGITLPLLKSMIWLVDAGLWEGLVQPISKISAGSVGYVMTKGVVYPVLVTADTLEMGGSVIIESVKFSGDSVYYVFAPSAKLATASVLSSFQAITEQTEYIGLNATRPISQGALSATKYAGQGVIVTSGYVGKLTTKYIIMPAGFLATNTLASASGAIVGASGISTGAVYGASGKALKLSSDIVQGAVIGTGTAIGTGVSTVYAGGVMLFHTTSSIVVPSSKILGSGLVLTYGMLSQLSAHTILALGDVSYVVLSMEGPKWVLYGITGKVDKANHPQGTIIDLEKLQEKGETIKRLELTPEEAQKLF